MSGKIEENMQASMVEEKVKKPETIVHLLKKILVKYIKEKEKKRPLNKINLSKGDLLQRYNGVRKKHLLYGLVSFLMTAMFYMAFTSPDWVLLASKGVWGDTQSMSKAIGAVVWAFLGLMFAITITVLIMHSHTTDRAGSSFLRIIAYAMIILLGVVFNVFTETASTMDRVDERVIVKSENSAIFKALTGSISNSSGEANKALTKAKNDYSDALSTKAINLRWDGHWVFYSLYLVPQHSLQHTAPS